MKLTKKIKTLITLSAAAITIGTITPIIIFSMPNKDTSFQGSNTSLHGEDLINAYKAKSAEMTEDRLAQYETSIEYKLAAKLNAAHVSDSGIRAMVGKYLANLESFQPTNSNPTENLTEIYDYAAEQGRLLDVDVVDYQNTEENLIPLLTEMVYDETGDKATTQTFHDTLENTLSISKSSLDDNLRMSETFWYQWKDLVSDSRSKIENPFLDIALAYFQDTIENEFIVAGDTTAFSALLEDYSATGKYHVGSIIDNNDLQKLFSYEYDVTYSAPYEQLIPKYIDDIKATTPGNYDNSILEKTVRTLPFGSQKVETQYGGGTYLQGDFIPGYQLHAKIINKDTITDSHRCELTIQFGVSAENDPEDILWSTINDDNEQSVTNFTLDIHDLSQMQYIAAHTYYPGKEAIIDDKSLLQTTLPSGAVVFGEDTKSQRTKLDKIINNYFPNLDEIDWNENAIYFDANNTEDFAGLPIPKPLNADFYSTQPLHTHQKLVLKASYCDFNDNYLSLNWCYIDGNVTQGSTEDSDLEYQDIRNVQWDINGVKYDKINLVYDISADLKAKLNLASALCDSIINLTKTLDEQKTHLEYTNDQVDTMLDFNTSIRATEMVLEIASTTTAAICTVISVVVPTPKAIWDAAIATAIAVTNGISIGCEITAMVNDYKTKKDERTFDTTLTNMKDTFDQLSAVCEQKKSILDDPNKTYSAKSKAAAEVITNVDDQLMNKLNGLLDASKASLDLDSSTINDYKNVVNTKTDMDKDEYTDQDLADMNLKANAYLVIAEAYVSTMAEYGDLILEQSYTWGMTSLFGGKMQGHEDDTARIVKEWSDRGNNLAEYLSNMWQVQRLLPDCWAKDIMNAGFKVKLWYGTIQSLVKVLKTSKEANVASAVANTAGETVEVLNIMVTAFTFFLDEALRIIQQIVDANW